MTAILLGLSGLFLDCAELITTTFIVSRSTTHKLKIWFSVLCSDIHFINITGRSENGGLVSGLTGGSSEPYGALNISFENIHIKIASWSNYSQQSQQLSKQLPPPCYADPIICSNESHPHCTDPAWPVQPGSALHCSGTQDYRPHNGGNCSYYCRTPAKVSLLSTKTCIHGMTTATLETMMVFFNYILTGKFLTRLTVSAWRTR